MTVPVQKPRRVINGSGWANPLTHTFPLEQAAYLSVWADDIELTLGLDYTVSGVGNPAGFAVTISHPEDWAPVAWVLDVEYPIDQPSDVDQGGQFGKRFEDALDRLALGLQTLDDRTARAIKVARTTDPAIDVTASTPEPDSLIGWNADGTALENKGSVPQVQDVALHLAEIDNVSDHMSSVLTVELSLAEINTVAADIAAVRATGGAIASVVSVAANLTNIDINAANMANIVTVAGVADDIADIAPSVDEIVTVAGSIANVNTVAGSIANVNTVGGAIGSVNTVAGSIANVNTVATNNAKVTTVADGIVNINTAADNMAAITAAPAAAAKAQAWAENPEDVPVETGKFSALHWAAKAAAAVTGGIAAAIHAAAGKATPADADELGIVDSAASWGLKKLTWANLKAALIAQLGGSIPNTFALGNDARLSDAREWTGATVSQAEAEAGVATTRRAWTAERVKQAIAANAPPPSGLGIGQSWVDVTASRVKNTSYQNTTGKPIALELRVIANSSAATLSYLRISSDGTSWIDVCQVNGASELGFWSAVVPNSMYYLVSNNIASIQRWAELR